MPAIIRKEIKEDLNKKPLQVSINIKENDINIVINQTTGISKIDLSYNQLCSLSRVINSAIDNHYQEYSNSMVKEKTARIYIDDPIDW